MVIYIDILISVNLIINYLLLSAVKSVLKIDSGGIRMGVSAFFGALYSLVILLPPFSFLLSSFLKLLVSAVMTAIAFRKTTILAYIKRLICFYIIGVLFGGGMYLLYFCFGSAIMEIGNGITYLKISAPVLVLTAGGIYFLLCFLQRFFFQSSSEKEILKIRITKGGKRAELFGFCDNGNRLYDRMENLPVIVCSKRAAEPIIEDDEKEFFEGNINFLKPPYKLVPFNSVGGKGLLPSFSPERLEVFIKGKWQEYSKITVAVSLDSFGEYDCILPKNFLEGEIK